MTAPNVVKVEHAGRGHVELAPSSAARWVECPGSIQLTRGIPRQSSLFADEGTAAHELADMCLTTGKDPIQFLGTKLGPEKAFTVDEEMADAVGVYVRYVRELFAGSLWHQTEARLEFPKEWDPPGPMGGTVDSMAIVRAEDRQQDRFELHVCDLKYGRGVVVEPRNNLQLQYYALCALGQVHKVPTLKAILPKIDVVVITIVQPRAPHQDGPIRSVEVGLPELLETMEKLLAAGNEALLTPNPKLNAGKHCRFCPALARCPEAARSATAEAAEEFSMSPQLLTPHRVGELLAWAKDFLEPWIASLTAEVRTGLEQGHDVPGWKIVEKRATRKWADVAEVEKWAKTMKLKKSEIFEMQLISVARMEKIVGKDYIPPQLVEKHSSGVTLARATDPRQVAANGSEFFNEE